MEISGSVKIGDGIVITGDIQITGTGSIMTSAQSTPEISFKNRIELAIRDVCYTPDFIMLDEVWLWVTQEPLLENLLQAAEDDCKASNYTESVIQLAWTCWTITAWEKRHV